ncbi:MAG: PAS domain S-box protein [Burkholderiales bacterium]|nr:PAS domain S-box protein [Burkholderiales bacterium]
MTAAEPTAANDASSAAVLDARRIDALFRESSIGLAVAPLVAAVCAALFWRHAGAWAIAWFAAVLLVSLLRYGLCRRYAERAAGAALGRWEQWFVAGTAVHGLAWAALAALAASAGPELRVFATFAVGGMAIGAVALLGASRAAFAAFTVPSLGAMLSVLAVQSEAPQRAMAVLVLVFGVALWRIYRNFHRELIQNLARGLANERLLAEQRGLFDAATVGIALVRDGRIVDCNRALADLLGWSGEELLAAPHSVWACDAKAWNAVMAESGGAACAGESFRREVDLRHKDGRTVRCELSSRPVWPDAPERGMVLVLADLTARLASERALRESEQRLDLVVRASQGGLWDWDIAADATYYSPSFKAILGYPPDADFGAIFRFKEWLHPDDRERVLVVWYRALAHPSATFDAEYRLRCADGGYRWVHGRGLVICGAGGRAVRSVGSIIDISDRKLIEERLRESERHFRYLVENANDLVWMVDRDGRWTYLSPRATQQIFACAPEDMIGCRMVETQPEADRPRTEAMLARVLAEGTASHFETGHLNRAGERIVLSLNAMALRDDAGRIVGVTGTATDITPLKRKEVELSAALEDQSLIFDSVAEGIVILRNGVVRRCNRKFATMLGYAPEELAGKPALLWYADASEWNPDASLPRAARYDQGALQCEIRVKRKDGSMLWCDARGRPLHADRPEEGSIWIYIDISARKERESRIQHLADHDALTGLLNRRMFEDRLRQAIALARRGDRMVALMLIDLDGFKVVNDSYGHLTGDYVLRTVARRILEAVRESDTVARLGGDEFVVVLMGPKSAEDAALVAEKILAALSGPIPAGGRRFEIGASIGISIFPRDGLTPEALLSHADAAMYRVKDAGKNRYQFYSS